MNKNRDMSLPTNTNKDEIADKFFTDKVAKIRSDLDKKTLSIRNEDSHTVIKLKENILYIYKPISTSICKRSHKNYNELTIKIIQLTLAVRGYTFIYNN